MTIVTVKRCEDGIRSIGVSGHSGYAEAGSDIICAAASVLITTCANALETVAGIQPDVYENERNAEIRVTLPGGVSPQQMHDSQVILESILQGYRDVANGYPKFLKINDGRTSSC
jgi:uncharacterized protein YsxB (DUF464 family)